MSATEVFTRTFIVPLLIASARVCVLPSPASSRLFRHACRHIARSWMDNGQDGSKRNLSSSSHSLPLPARLVDPREKKKKRMSGKKGDKGLSSTVRTVSANRYHSVACKRRFNSDVRCRAHHCQNVHPTERLRFFLLCYKCSGGREGEPALRLTASLSWYAHLGNWS